MTDLISRSAVLEILSNEFDMAAEERAESDNEKDRAFNAGEINCARRSTRKVENLPFIDAIPVVRCKDCKHWRPCAGATEYVKCCEFAGYMVGANGYCVYGEKREEDTDETD